jgi:hypothetical protein
LKFPSSNPVAPTFLLNSFDERAFELAQINEIGRGELVSGSEIRSNAQMP